jgi:hypothetical protein
MNAQRLHITTSTPGNRFAIAVPGRVTSRLALAS